MSPQLAVLGSGSWGTALAMALAPRFDSVHLWSRDSAQAAEMRELRENRRYLPGFRLPSNVDVSADLAQALSAASIVLTAIPSAHLRKVVLSARPHIPSGAYLVSASKGLEEGSLSRMSQLIADVLSASVPLAVLSGPTFAKEIAAAEPAAVVIAAGDIAVAEEIQRAFSTPSLRLYASSDVVGVELGAALKNVIAIGAGICRGLGLGSNSAAALITRGLAEITRLALALGAQPRTLAGLAGLGDLVLTATGDLSRNRFVGIQLGQGRGLGQILAGMTMVAEGVSTCRAAYQLGRDQDVDLPIINKMYEVLYESKDPRQAIRELMERPLTSE
ncbi:MAG TPA: NAD(P)H-dependent glycerol-3-phosphate dehydrogenase [Bryobacteraceae bacterium]|jgi:glycerol-3-phosphate dehydrogenase (NAD(P)+)|nr:NAD(P)H-dependent glycerol-3-phosphate dehydrogenase [Bryobacteraceae bacterium]